MGEQPLKLDKYLPHQFFRRSLLDQAQFSGMVVEERQLFSGRQIAKFTEPKL